MFNGNFSNSKTVFVLVKPKITYLENQTATEMEEQIRLTCEATGDPTPSITWATGTHVFLEGEQVFILPSADEFSIRRRATVVVFHLDLKMHVVY